MQKSTSLGNSIKVKVSIITTTRGYTAKIFTYLNIYHALKNNASIKAIIKINLTSTPSKNIANKDKATTTARYLFKCFRT